MASGKGFLLWVFCSLILGASARLHFNEEFIDRRRGMHELAKVKEYDSKQGFEAMLHFVSNSGNKTYGADINPLHLVVRYVVV